MTIRDVRLSTALKSNTRVRGDWNYNKVVASITRPGQVIMHQAEDDPVAHPMYVDAEGRSLPVSPATLQIMVNGSGHVVDKFGVRVPPYEYPETNSTLVHEDDVRVAVAARDVVTLDKDDEEIYIAPDGTIIPTGNDGLPNVVMVGGVPWATDAYGEPVAPLESVIPLGTYHKPVEARNYPMTEGLSAVALLDQAWDEYFPIESIIEPHRPRRRGALKAWATSEGTQISSYTGVGEYIQGRFYTVSEEMQYKYWTPDEPAALGGVEGTTTTVPLNDGLWATSNVTSIILTAGQFSGNFNWFRGLGNPNISRELTLKPGVSYTLNFTLTAQANSNIRIYLEERVSYAGGKRPAPKLISAFAAPASVAQVKSLAFTTKNNADEYILRIESVRTNVVSSPRITVSGMTLNETTYPLQQAGPRVTYDRPLKSNKIVIGVDYTVDERHADSASNMPISNNIMARVERSDGVQEWKVIATNVLPNADGLIELYYNGTTWQEDEHWGGEVVNVSAIHFNVWGMNISRARLNVTEISLHMLRDLSDRFMNYSTDYSVSDDSFVLPFGTISSNVGTMTLSNHDGLFNNDNPFLLDSDRYADGEYVFTDVLNPLYRLLGSEVDFVVDTEVHDADFAYPVGWEPEWIRMFTMAGSSPEVDYDMNATFNLKDSSRILQQRKPNHTFYSDHDGMSVVQVLFMLLDSVGFTNVKFDPHDQFEATHMQYYWTRTDDTVWAAIEDICRSTQVTAYFNEYDELCFRSLKALYNDALSQPAKDILTTDDVEGNLANIIDVSDGELFETNKVQVNYRELRSSEITESGVAKMEEVWSPEGDVVLRSQALRHAVHGESMKQTPLQSITLQPRSTTTWPFEGMVNVEGELIKYRGKEYLWRNANGTIRYNILYSEEERREKDKVNVDLAHTNYWTGKLRTVERGAEGTRVRAHGLGSLTGYSRRFRRTSTSGTGDYSPGISFANSKMRLNPARSGVTITSDSNYVVSRGSTDSYPAQFMGTSVNIVKGSNCAGLAFGLDLSNNGIYVELNTTEQVEALGRKRNELSIYVRRNGKREYLGANPEGIVAPIVNNKFYKLDVAYFDGVRLRRPYLYAPYEHLTLKSGSKGTAVKVLQKGLNRDWKEKLTVDGVFGSKTVAAVKRAQKIKGITPRDGIVNLNDWRALGGYIVDANSVSIQVWLDGSMSHSIVVEKSKMPPAYDGGRYGMFVRAKTVADFEYLYGFRGSEDLVDDGDNGMLSKVTGSYFSDQTNNGYVYNRKKRYVVRGGKKVLRNSINDQFFFDDFGAYAHEVRDWNVEFSDLDRPAEYSNLYFSNTEAAIMAEYKHTPFSASFRLANTARHDAILNGEDLVTYGADDGVDQQMLIYGRVLQEDSERVVTVEDRNATRSRGVNELTIDANWIQSTEAANKLGSHIVEAMGNAVRTFDITLFGNPYLKVGDMVVLYAPAQGVSVKIEDDVNRGQLQRANRYVITGINHANDGTHQTTVNIRQLIDDRGMRYVRLSDVLDSNNNNMLRNQYLDEFEVVANRRLIPKDVDSRSQSTISYLSDGSGKGHMNVQGNATTSPANYKNVGFSPKNILLQSGARPAHNIGDYYLWTVDVTAHTNCTAVLHLGGYNTSGYNRTLAETRVRLKKGKRQRLVLTGRYMENGDVPEVLPMFFLMTYDGAAGTMKEKIKIHDMFYRSSNSEDNIYPNVGYATLRRP